MMGTNCKSLKNMVRPERFELPTLCFEGRCSIQLSYGRADCFYDHIIEFAICGSAAC